MAWIKAFSTFFRYKWLSKNCSLALLLSCSLALLLSCSLTANAYASPYFEAGYSALNYEEYGPLKTTTTTLTGKSSPSALRLLAGYAFHPNFAVEGFYGFGLSEADASIELKNAAGANVSINGLNLNSFKLKIENFYGVAAKGKFAINDFELFARLGLGVSTGKVSYPGISTSSSADTSFLLGVGASYSFTNTLYAIFDYTSYLDKKDSKTTPNSTSKLYGMTLGLGYKL